MDRIGTPAYFAKSRFAEVLQGRKPHLCRALNVGPEGPTYKAKIKRLYFPCSKRKFPLLAARKKAQRKDTAEAQGTLRSAEAAVQARSEEREIWRRKVATTNTGENSPQSSRRAQRRKCHAGR